MPELVPKADGGAAAAKGEVNGILNKEIPVDSNDSPKSTLRPESPGSAQEEAAPGGGGGSGAEAADGGDPVEASIEQLYYNVCDMQSSDQSPSRRSFASDGDESRIDSELRHLVGGEMREVEIMEEEVADDPQNDGGAVSANGGSVVDGQTNGSAGMQQPDNNHLEDDGSPDQDQLESTTPTKSTPKKKTSSSPGKTEKQNGLMMMNSKKRSVVGSTPRRKPRDFPLVGAEAALDNPDLGPFLLKQARDLISSGDNLNKALDLAHRAAKSFEVCANGKPSLDMVMALHVTAAIHCSLGQYSDAIPILEQSVKIPSIEQGQDHALAKFAGEMQLGDTFAILGLLENSILCYTRGLEIQKQALGERDPRVGETCRYLAEAHVQAMQLDEAEKICDLALEIHRDNGSPGSLEEAADRRLMGLICQTKGDHEAALEHLVLASMSMAASGLESEVASVDCSIGDAYMSLSRYDEAIFAYQKALAVFKSAKGENHPTVASVFVRLAELYNKTGKLRDSKSYCENALRIYTKPVPGTPSEEVATGLTDVSAIYESMNELDQAIKLLQKALKIYNDAPGQQNTIAGIEAQIGVMYYMLGNYGESYDYLKRAITKLRASSEKKSAFFGVALNQMGLVCVQRYSINEAADLFEEARTILEQEYGPYHPDTLGVYSNLAGTYDAIGRLDDAIELLEYVVGMREDKLGTANPDVDDEKRRLGELLKEAGRVRSRRASSLINLMNSNPQSNNSPKNSSVEV